MSVQESANQTYRANFESAYFQDYYSGYRDKLSDLFPSEAFFFSNFANRGNSFLDVGCASGGFVNILSEARNGEEFKYTGVDFSSKQIEQARARNPECGFRIASFSELGTWSERFDQVLALGATVHDPNFFDTLMSCIKLSLGELLFDMRLVIGSPTINDIKRGRTIDGSGEPYPYIVANMDSFIDFLLQNIPKNANVSIFGYPGKPNEFTVLPVGYDRIYFCGVLIQKEDQQDDQLRSRLQINLLGEG